MQVARHQKAQTAITHQHAHQHHIEDHHSPHQNNHHIYRRRAISHQHQHWGINIHHRIIDQRSGTALIQFSRRPPSIPAWTLNLSAGEHSGPWSLIMKMGRLFWQIISLENLSYFFLWDVSSLSAASYQFYNHLGHVGTMSTPTKHKLSSGAPASRKKAGAALSPQVIEYLRAWMMSPDHINHPYPTGE